MRADMRARADPNQGRGQGQGEGSVRAHEEPQSDASLEPATKAEAEQTCPTGAISNIFAAAQPRWGTAETVRRDEHRHGARERVAP